MSNPHARRPRGSALRPSHATHAHRVYSRSSSFDLTHLHGSIVCSMDTSGSSGLFAATDGRVLIASHDSRAPGGAAPSPRSEAAGAAAVAAPSPRSEAAGAAAVAAPSLRSEAAGAAAVAAPSPRPAGGAPSAEDRACAHCGKRGCFLICGRCNSVYYCSSDCGRADKAKHRASCNRTANKGRTLELQRGPMKRQKVDGGGSLGIGDGTNHSHRASSSRTCTSRCTSLI
jgi:hypothetical protein